MVKKLLLVLALVTTVVLLYFYVDNAYKLFSGSYIVDEDNLYKIDTFHLFRRAFESSDGAGRHAERTLVFESTNRYSFAISGNIYQAITNLRKLEDTLMYHDSRFTVYSSKEFYEQYRTTKSPISIPVYQIQVGDIKYVDISLSIRLAKGKLLRNVIIPPVVVLFITIGLYPNIRWTDWRRLTFAVIIVWAIFCLLLLSSMPTI